MAYYVVDNFRAGLDLRRSSEMAPPGSLRALQNAFINEGGEIEKRKAFVKDATLTAYAQDAQYAGKVTGPFEVPGHPEAVYFRHRDNSLPAGFTAGTHGNASYIETGSGYQGRRFWAMKSSTALSGSPALFRAESVSEHSNYGYLVEKYLSNTDDTHKTEHAWIEFDSDEPKTETMVAANAGRGAQLTLDNKGYVISDSELHISATGDPSDMAGTGSGALILNTRGKSIGNAISSGEYFGQLAIMGRRGVHFYQVDADPAATQYLRTVQAQVFAPRTAVGYGDGDLVFLGRSGVRSLTARDSSNLAKVGDMGSPIDSLIRAELKYDPDVTEPVYTSNGTSFPVADFYDVAKATIDPGTGHLWVALRGKVYVLSVYPSSKVMAWAQYDLPVPTAGTDISGPIKGQWVADVAPISDTLAFRNFADEVFVYGGEDSQTYDATQVVVELPPMDFGKPGHEKTFTGVGIVGEGYWEIEAATVIPSEGNTPSWFKIAEIHGSSRALDRVGGFDFSGTQIALRLTTTSQFDARLAQVVVFYQGGSER